MGEIAKKLKTARLPYAAAVIVAAGSGTRFGGDKLMADLGRIPVLAHTLRAFEAVQAIREIVLVTRREMTEDMAELCRAHSITKISNIVPGGDTRAQSSLAGVMAVSEYAELVAIQDGARPLVTGNIIMGALWTAYRHMAGVPAVPVRDTVKQARDGVVENTPDRSALFAVQTPQCFQADIIRAALMDAVQNAPGVTDDCLAVERIGGRIYLSEGSEENIKITTPLDLKLAELILAERAKQ